MAALNILAPVIHCVARHNLHKSGLNKLTYIYFCTHETMVRKSISFLTKKSQSGQIYIFFHEDFPWGSVLFSWQFEQHRFHRTAHRPMKGHLDQDEMSRAIMFSKTLLFHRRCEGVCVSVQLKGSESFEPGIINIIVVYILSSFFVCGFAFLCCCKETWKWKRFSQ